jgi:hypothetical protein
LLRILTLNLVMVSQVESDRRACIADEFQLKYIGAKFSCARSWSLYCYFILCYLTMAVYKFDSVFVTRWTTSKLQPVGRNRYIFYIICMFSLKVSLGDKRPLTHVVRAKA